MQAVIFIGIQATGKSTFYKEHFYDTHVRINLDMLHTRAREAILVEACIRAQQPFVVDNTNIRVDERARYIQKAKPTGFRIIGYYFDSSLRDALARNRQREGRALIPDAGLLNKYRRLQLPRYAEGFDQIFYVTINPQGGFNVQEWTEPEG